MTTLKRELRIKFKEILNKHNLLNYLSEEYVETICEELASMALEWKPKFSAAKFGIDWAIAAGEEVDPETVEGEIIKKEAFDAFERDMKFGTLPWDSTSTWERMAKFVVVQYQKDKEIWLKYKVWQRGKGKYLALSNKQIRENPDNFIACFPDFLAHTAMNPEPRRPYEEDANGIPMS